MSKHYRYRFPPWLFKCVIVMEKCTLPLLIYQLIRTLLFPTTLDVLLLGMFVGLFLAFYLKWL